MTPCCRILIPCRSNSFLGLPLKKTHNSFSTNSSNFRLNFGKKCDFHSYPPRILGAGRIINRTQKLFCVPNSSWGQSRVFSRHCHGINPIRASKRGFHVIASVASDFRNYSTSVEKNRVNDKNFERIYVQGGLNVKPLVVEKIDLDEHAANGQHVNDEKVESVKEEGKGQVGVQAGEESQTVNEAWKLLENAVVTYCGSPIGTVAANDPNDKLPLNYDQVFIRDFIPSALAFLLKGEKEIVRNFLLHTLQLQSWEKTVDCYSPGQGLMPASFKVRTVPLDDNKYEEVLDPDFGESAIGRVAPVDSGKCLLFIPFI
ncbi:hypothetical protein HAX54_020136 [Datura stramonium]|uniref:Alkaline/neutral invertase n=1 Tax=Datura stramonium TaxID=4076 RepID=A0ABS8Y650_DATST|nr:hypothetical protein [Datura stramonium]